MIGLVGCSGIDSSKGSQDSDGDGVSDSEDYAPQDPEVQKKSDLEGTDRPTASDSPTATEEPTPVDDDGYNPNKSPTPIQGLISRSPALRPIEVESFVDDYSSGVRGTVENISDRTLDYVQANAYFYVGDTRVGEGLDNATDLLPGTKWEFKCTYFGDSEWESYVVGVDTQL